MQGVLEKVIVICGAGHSGSTLLGLILDGHTSCFYVGEGAKIRYLHDENRTLRKRVCKICGTDCKVWSHFVWDTARSLYEQVAVHTGTPVIVDSTKNPAWITARMVESDAAHVSTCLLFLTRDGRAVINSRVRKYPDRDPAAMIEDWKDQIAKSEQLFNQHSGPKLRIKYEAIATDPEAAIAQICDTFGLSFQEHMLAFQAHDHHPLGGNNGTQYQVARSKYSNPDQAFVSLGDRSREYYTSHPDGIALDLRWKTEFKQEHVDLFDRLAGDFNRDIKWEA